MTSEQRAALTCSTLTGGVYCVQPMDHDGPHDAWRSQPASGDAPAGPVPGRRRSPMTSEERAALDPGIRDVVVALRAAGFRTCDSGDGASKPDMGCALPWRHVAASVAPIGILSESRRMLRCLRSIEPDAGWIVEATYYPHTGDPHDGEALLFARIAQPGELP